MKVSEIIGENELMDRPGTKVRGEFDDHTENNEEETVMMELDGLLHFGQILADLKQGKKQMVEVDTSLSSEEFFKRYALGIK